MTLLQAEKEADLDKTEDEIEYLVEMLAQLEETLSRKREELDKLGNNVTKSSRSTGLEQVSYQYGQAKTRTPANTT